MENNQEEKLQEEQVQNPEVNEKVEENTDNLSEKEENTDKNRKNIFSRKKDKDKTKVQELEKEIEQLKARKKHWWDDFCNFYRQFNSMNRRSSEEGVRLTSMQLYHAEAKILRELAEQESCIIIGRSAFHIFRHNPNAWKVLLIANDEHRIRHLTQKYGITAEEASRRMTDADEARENYTLTFASTSRYDARLYDLVCNVSNLDPDHVANFLADLARRRFGL